MKDPLNDPLVEVFFNIALMLLVIQIVLFFYMLIT